MKTESFKFKVLLTLLIILFALLWNNAHAEEVTINQVQLGSGVPSESGVTNAPLVMDGMYHAPQYLPGYPTAATIFPRVLDVDCTKTDGGVTCAGYNWLPEMGRAEYLYIRPHVREVPPPVVIYKEVPVKKGLE